MYKVYINSLLNELMSHCYAISINRLSLSSPSFADDIALLALYPTFLYGETKHVHFKEMKEREWILGDGTRGQTL